MDQVLGSPHDHIRIMELRIEHQNELIAKLRSTGEDTQEAARTLALLHKALDEMRLQLGMLAPTAMDARRATRHSGR